MKSKYFHMAEIAALRSRVKIFRIGCVIVRRGKILGVGYNKHSGEIEKVEKKLGTKLFSLHAEMAAIVDSSELVRGATMYISGYKKNGRKISSCKPCPDCLKMIKMVGISRVVYEENGDVITVDIGK